MKIVLPVHHFPPRYSAGAELYTFRLARWLNTHSHQAEVVCVERIDVGGSDILVEHENYQGVPVWRLSFDLLRSPDPMLWSYNNPLIGRWFAEYLAQQQPDLVHVQSGYLMSGSVLEAAHNQSVPSILTLHDFWFLCPRITLLRGDSTICDGPPADPAGCAWCMRLASRRYRLPNQISGGLFGKAALAVGMQSDRLALAGRRAYLIQALEYASAVIAPSHFLADVFADQLAMPRPHVLRLGIETERLQHTPLPRSDKLLRLGYIGQIAPHKGVHLLVEALQLLPVGGMPVELTIYGDLDLHPMYSQRLRQRASSDPRVRLAGRFDNERIVEVLAGLDVTVVPSVWYENSPLALMEAQAARRPVIATALGGMAELVHDGVNGLLFQSGDAVDLARQIQRLRDDPMLLPRLRQGVVPPATIDDEMRSLLQIYEQALCGHTLPALEPVS